MKCIIDVLLILWLMVIIGGYQFYPNNLTVILIKCRILHDTN
jgi:hypothetical protein